MKKKNKMNSLKAGIAICIFTMLIAGSFAGVLATQHQNNVDEISEDGANANLSGDQPIAPLQTSNVKFNYYGPFEYSGNRPLTYGGDCFNGTGIPNGIPVNVYAGGVLAGSHTMNGEGSGMGPGYFWSSAYVSSEADQMWYCIVSHNGTTYTSDEFGPFVSGSQNNIVLDESEWTCESSYGEPPVFSNENPTNGSTDIPVTTSSLTVTIEDPEGDSIYWSIETNPDVGSSNGAGEYNGTKTCTITGLEHDITYTWVVTATDLHGSQLITEETYTFTTMHNEPPSLPTQPTGPISGEVGVEYTYETGNSIDPEGFQVQYRFDWGDEQYSDWTPLGDSGHIVSLSHSWMYLGIYSVRAQVRDEFGATSEWSEGLTVNVSSGIDLWWPMFHHDLSNRGYSTSPAPDINKVKWMSPVGVYERHFSSPAVAYDRVYIGNEYAKVYCLDAYNGTEVWNSSILGGQVRSSPAVVNNRVYVGSGIGPGIGNCCCLDPSNGTELWNFAAGGGVLSSPAVAYGNVYFGSYNDYVYCLDAETGAKVWEFETGDDVKSSPAVADGMVYVGSSDGKLYCLDAVGNGDGLTMEIWNYSASNSVHSSPAVVDGMVYFGDNGNVYCLYASNGTEVWKNAAGGGMESSPAVAYGKVYIGKGSYLYCYASNGTVIWSFHTGDSAQSSPAVADGKVYIGSHGSYDNEVYCLDAETGNHIWSYTTDGSILSPAVALGNVYFGSSDGNVYCITGENEPPNKPNLYGTTKGEIVIPLCFNVSTADSDGDQVRYGWGWDGDDVVDEWTGFYNSSVNVTKCHTWGIAGVYDVKVKAEDVYGAQSNWSDPLTVTIINEPPDPPLQPVGPTEGMVGVEYTFSTNTTDPEGHQVKYGWDWDGDGVIEVGDWTPYYPSGVNVTRSRTWMEGGTYDIQVIAVDKHGAVGNWSEPLTITINNEAPDPPSEPEGPTQGAVNVAYSFSTSTVDSDGHQVKYGWDCDGDGVVDPNGWTGWYDSGETINHAHYWSVAGIYDIQVLAYDGFEFGDWSPSHRIYIQEGEPDLAIREIIGELFQVSVDIKNIGEGSIVFVSWNITVKGGLLGLIDVEADGTIDLFEADGVETISTIDHGKIFGLGPVDITVTVSAPDVDPVEKTATAVVFGPFVFGVSET